MSSLLEDIETFIFCDETKFSIANSDKEDAIYYFGISVIKKDITKVNQELKEILQKHKVKSEVYHSTKVFRESRPRLNLMDDLTQVVIRNRLKCFCHKYEKSKLFETTKILQKFNNEIINFNKAEFQALFYFLTVANTYLRDKNPNLLKRGIAMYFDRNVYGVEDTEAFTFPSEHFVLKQMTFTEKSKTSLLLLPDFFGYIFRKSKISKNKIDFGDKALETSTLTINAFKNLTEINTSKLFYFIETNQQTIEKALKHITK
jgi:hypothetical protein